MDNSILVAKGDKDLHLLPKMANRHGLITGATGTGKTVTLQGLAESFSALGIPVFLSDIKGDLSGLCEPGGNNPKIAERIKQMELANFQYQPYPVEFWDIFGEQGFPVRTTVSEMGPLLLSRILNLNDVQGGVLNVVFRVADDQGMLLLDLKDLKSMLAYVAENAEQYTVKYGNVSKQSVGAIQRALLAIEDQGAGQYFGEPALDIRDFIKTDSNGFGMINILACDKLYQSPALYSTFLLWLLSELFEVLPEVGDLDQPKMVFFFDEAHLLFTDAPKALLTKIEQVVRLIRSKGVGIYFITQNPVDIPDTVLGQLGNRVQHALRGYTPKDQKAIKAAAQTFRQNPKINIEEAITELGVGEALISFLDEKGRPTVVERAFILPPRSLVGTAPVERRREVMNDSRISGRYEKLIDRESAYELLQRKVAQQQESIPQQESRQDDKPASMGRPGRQPDSILETMAKTAVNTFGRQVARDLVRGILGSFMRK
jgi:DNA helicase HerA-like ATPase